MIVRLPNNQGGNGGDDDRFTGYPGRLSHLVEGGGDEGDHGGTDTLEYSLDPGIILEVGKYHGDKQDHDEGREYRAEAGENNAFYSPSLVTNENSRVEGYRSGGGLGDGEHLDKFAFFQPSFLVDDLFLDQGDHGVTAS